MNGIFGPNTPVVLAFLTRLPDLSAEDIGRVTNAWRQTESRDHAEAWAELHGETTQGERHRILAAASVARQTALDMAGRHPEWEFRAAASDAAAALAAGHRIGHHYDTLISPLAAVMPWLPPGPGAAPDLADIADSHRPSGGPLRPSDFDALPYTPTARASTDDALPGTSISFSVNGFAANEVILVYLACSRGNAGQLVTAFGVNDQGSASDGSYVIPSDAGNPLYFTLVGQKSGGSATAKVSVTATTEPVSIPSQPPTSQPVASF